MSISSSTAAAAAASSPTLTYNRGTDSIEGISPDGVEVRKEENSLIAYYRDPLSLSTLFDSESDDRLQIGHLRFERAISSKSRSSYLVIKELVQTASTIHMKSMAFFALMDAFYSICATTEATPARQFEELLFKDKGPYHMTTISGTSTDRISVEKQTLTGSRFLRAYDSTGKHAGTLEYQLNIHLNRSYDPKRDPHYSHRSRSIVIHSVVNESSGRVAGVGLALLRALAAIAAYYGCSRIASEVPNSSGYFALLGFRPTKEELPLYDIDPSSLASSRTFLTPGGETRAPSRGAAGGAGDSGDEDLTEGGVSPSLIMLASLATGKRRVELSTEDLLDATTRAAETVKADDVITRSISGGSGRSVGGGLEEPSPFTLPRGISTPPLSERVVVRVPMELILTPGEYPTLPKNVEGLRALRAADPRSMSSPTPTLFGAGARGGFGSPLLRRGTGGSELIIDDETDGEAISPRKPIVPSSASAAPSTAAAVVHPGIERSPKRPTGLAAVPPAPSAGGITGSPILRSLGAPLDLQSAFSGPGASSSGGGGGGSTLAHDHLEGFDSGDESDDSDSHSSNWDLGAAKRWREAAKKAEQDEKAAMEAEQLAKAAFLLAKRC